MTRTPRELETREDEIRTEEWNPASLLPDPTPSEEWAHRWVRKASLGETDVMNMSRKRREGYEVVTPQDQPELAAFSDSKDHIEVGGLVLMRLPRARARARDAHYRRLAQNQIDGLPTNFRKEASEDSRMPIEEQRITKVSRSPV